MGNGNVTMEEIVSLCKRRGFVFQASEIYGGLAGFWDYGPLGVELVNNIKNLWWRSVVHNNDNIYGIDGAVVQNPKLWEASGHVAGFTDPLVDCRYCGARYRADHLAGVDSCDTAELEKLLKEKACPECGKKELTKPRTYNMMMKTWVGPIEDESSLAYLRPETAGSIFTNFKNVIDTMHPKLPFGIAQIGKVFRNEISPRDFIFRAREFEQMEMQYFIRPDNQEESYEKWRNFAWNFLINNLGMDEKNMKWHEHADNERAHYASAAHDINFNYGQKFEELWGTHNRTDFDLRNQSKYSGQDLSYLDPESSERLLPFVIESSVGVGRLFLAVLFDSYKEDELDGNKRVFLKMSPAIAPVKAAVFPLLKNKPELVSKAREVYTDLKKESADWRTGSIMWDDNSNIGKRYRRQDEIGTPLCITIDFETLEDDTITVRDRDTGSQKRIASKEVGAYVSDCLTF